MILRSILDQTNGLDVLQKAGQLDHSVRLILMSGYQSLAESGQADLSDRRLPDCASQALPADVTKRTKELGAAGFLPKPFMIQALLHAVENSRRKA